MLFGYNVRLFHFFRIEEAPRQPGRGMIQQLAEQERDRQISDRDARIQALEGKIEALKGEKQAIEGENEELEGENQDLRNKLKRLVSALHGFCYCNLVKFTSIYVI
jgi:predicted RNase H-like nuclease (RuvC/YqgF family)